MTLWAFITGWTLDPALLISLLLTLALYGLGVWRARKLGVTRYINVSSIPLAN